MNRAKATKPGNPTIYVELSESEIKEFEQMKVEHDNITAENITKRIREKKQKLKSIAASKAQHELLMTGDSVSIRANYQLKVSEIDSKKTLKELEGLV